MGSRKLQPLGGDLTPAISIHVDNRQTIRKSLSEMIADGENFKNS